MDTPRTIPTVGDPIDYCHIKNTRHGLTMTTRHGVVRKLRTVTQALVVPEKGSPEWVDVAVAEETTSAAQPLTAAAAQ